jgi:hypothetical protein
MAWPISIWGATSPAGRRGDRARDVVDEGRAQVDARLPPGLAAAPPEAADPPGGGDLSEIYVDIYYDIKPTDAQDDE